MCHRVCPRFGLASYLGGYKHGDAECDGGEEHEEGGEERRVRPELRPLRLHDEAVTVGRWMDRRRGGKKNYLISRDNELSNTVHNIAKWARLN